MSKSTPTPAERAYFRRLGEAHVAAASCDPAGSLREVLRRIAEMESRLGALADPGAERDTGAEDAQLGGIVARWRGRRSRAR